MQLPRLLRPSPSVARVVALVGLAAGFTIGSSAARAATGPTQRSFVGAFTYSLANGAVDPPGADDWNCKPAAGQRPVILIHGYIANAYVPWATLSPELKKTGLCVFAINYSTTNPSGALSLYGTGPIRRSSTELAAFVERVRGATGAQQVDLVGHSEGGLLARTYLKYDGGAGKVNNLVSIAAVHNGTTLQGIGTQRRAGDDRGDRGRGRSRAGHGLHPLRDEGGLAVAYLDAVFDLLEANLAELRATEPSPLARVLRSGEAYLEHVIAYPAASRMASVRAAYPVLEHQDEPAKNLDRRIVTTLVSVAADLKDAMERGEIPRQPLDAAMTFVWGAWHGVATIVARGDHLAIPPDVARRALSLGQQLLLEGLRGGRE